MNLLNPTQNNVLFVFVAYDAKGKGVVQKKEMRRFDVIEGNVNNYSKLFNDPKRLKSINYFNQIFASVAEVSEEVEHSESSEKGKEGDRSCGESAKKGRFGRERTSEQGIVAPTPHCT